MRYRGPVGAHLRIASDAWLLYCDLRLEYIGVMAKGRVAGDAGSTIVAHTALQLWPTTHRIHGRKQVSARRVGRFVVDTADWLMTDDCRVRS